MKNDIVSLVRDTLIKAGSTFREDKKAIYREAIESERNDKAKWVLQTILENAEVAERELGPLCDDTGIPHLVLEVGKDCAVTGRMLDEIREGIKQGLRKLPGRPMGIMGDDSHRIDQSGGIDPDSAGVEPAPILLRRCEENVVRLHILMFGGGPAIRAKTHRVFHKHDTQVVLDEIVNWTKEGVAQLGCSPCTLAVGIGRSHFEATSMMLQAQVDGRYDIQSEMEKEITRRVNEASIGPLGLGGNTSVLATFVKVGPQRASGVRIVCVRPTCCFEPRIASVELMEDIQGGDDDMAISEQWLPIILEGVSWVKEKLGPSKKELKIQISDLEKQVQAFAIGNAVLINNFELIIQEILKQLKTDSDYAINADTIVFIGENTGIVDVAKSMTYNCVDSDDVVSKKKIEEFNVSGIFDGLDKEIAHSRVRKPSDRR